MATVRSTATIARETIFAPGEGLGPQILEGLGNLGEHPSPDQLFAIARLCDVLSLTLRTWASAGRIVGAALKEDRNAH